MRRASIVVALAVLAAVIAMKGDVSAHSGTGLNASGADVLTVGPAHVMGDAECDLDIGAADAIVILEAAGGLANGACAAMGDLNCSGTSDALDALELLRYIAGASALTQGCPRPEVPVYTLAEAAEAGTTELAITESLTDLEIGDYVAIDFGGPDQEVNQIAYFGSMGLEQGTELYHNRGAWVVKMPPPPSAPTGVTATAPDAHSIEIEWNDTSPHESGFEVSDAERPPYMVGSNVESYTVTGLAPGTYRCYHVRAYNVVGASEWAPTQPPYYACAITPDS